MHDLQHLYLDQLRDIYNAETQLVNALPKMADAATSTDLKQAFNRHHNQTQKHIERLETIFNNMNMPPQGETCEAMQGLIKESEDTIHKDGDANVKDAALIAAAQRVEHYEISAYGTVCAYAEQLSDTNSLDLLKKTLREEKRTDAQLTNLAVHTINPKAEHKSTYQHRNYNHWETVIALYDNFSSARGAIQELVDNGFDSAKLSLIANDNDERYINYIRHLDAEGTDDADVDSEEGAGFGAIIGTLAGLGVAFIPGLGGFVVAGAAGAALFAGLGALTGALTGGLTAGLIDLGVDEDRAESYTQRIQKGGAMVIAHVEDEWEDKAEAIMKNHNPINVEDIDPR